MKKLLLLSLLFASCAIQGEVYRLKTRIDNWYAVLSPEQLSLFAKKEYTKLGKEIDAQVDDNSEFAGKMRELRIDEAIMSFSGEQTARFYYEILLRDLVKFSFIEFMNALDSKQKVLFVQNYAYTENSFKSNKKIESIFQKARDEYGLKNFSDIQILNYYRQVSFPAVAYPAVYEVLSFLARYRTMESLLQGDIDAMMYTFENINRLLKSNRLSVRKQGQKDLEQWETLKKQMQLENISNKQFIELLYDYILPEMDQQVVFDTINNIRIRFKEQQ